MSTATRAITADEFFGMPDVDLREELIRGEVHSMPLPGGQHGEIAAEITLLLAPFVKARGLGKVVAEAGFLIERGPDTVRGPDVAFVRREQVERIVDRRKFIPFAPDLAVEVVSPNDRAAWVADKAAAWLAAGSAMVWVVDPKARTVAVHRPGVESETLAEGDTLEGGDVLPGFRCLVAEFFS